MRPARDGVASPSLPLRAVGDKLYDQRFIRLLRLGLRAGRADAAGNRGFGSGVVALRHQQ